MHLADSTLIGALGKEWAQVRFTHGLRHLKVPGLALHHGRSRLGLWIPAQRMISLSREHCLQDPWLEVQETMLHEIAHQCVDELHGGDETPHGPVFKRVLAALGALPTSTQGEEPPVVARVRKLLALAGSDNQHEAELAMARAQKLMITHRIDTARVDGARGVIRRQLGTPSKRQARWRGILAAVVGKHFFVEVLRVNVFLRSHAAWGTVWEIAGRPEDVEMAGYAFSFVEGTAIRLWRAHLRAHPGASRSRQRFLTGVVLGFRDKLAATAEEVAQRGLVPTTDLEVQRAWDRRHPRRRSARGTSQITDAHFRAGRKAGSNVVLHRPIQSRGTGGGLLEG